MGAAVWIIVSLLIQYLAFAAARGGLGTVGGLVISSAGLVNSYLWTVWYFVGVGIVHKLIGSSRAVASGVQTMLPYKVTMPVLVIVLLCATMICLSDTAALQLSGATGFPLETLFYAAAFLYQATKPWIWSITINGIAAHWFSTVLLFDLAVVIVLSLQKKLNGAAAIQLFYLTCLAGFLIWEYLFQLSSFARTPSHSLTVLFLFSAWLLWLMHTVGWNLCLKSSPAWPNRGRLAIYGGIVTLALLELNARAACSDFRVVNELFLTMFQGVINVGLPYFLYVWCVRKLPELPVGAGALLGVFSLGAITSFGLNIIEKLCGARWSFSPFVQVVQTQAERLLSIGSINIELQTPDYFFVLRALLFVCGVTLVYYAARRKLGRSLDASKAFVFLIMAYASGLASFARTLVELPIPPIVRALLAPCLQETQFNCNVFVTYLAYWLPALVFAIVLLVTRRKITNALWLGALLAAVGNCSIFSVYYHAEAVLRATGTLYYVMAMGCGAFVLLAVSCLKLLMAETPDVEAMSDGGQAITVSTVSEPAVELAAGSSNSVLLSSGALVVLIVVLELIFAVLVFKQTHMNLAVRQVEVFKHTVILPANWRLRTTTAGHKQPAAAASAAVITFTRSIAPGAFSMLQMGVVASDPKGTRSLLSKMLKDAVASKAYPNLSVVSVESWHRFYPGALACYFCYELRKGKTVMPMSGLVVLVPTRTGKTEYYTAYTNSNEAAQELAELAVVVNKLPRKDAAQLPL